MSFKVFTFVSAILISGIAMGQKNKNPLKNRPDQKIEKSLEDALYFDPAVNSKNLTINVSNGIATLKGEVFDLLSKERAIDIAEDTRGVRSIVNQLEVNYPKKISASEIEKDLAKAFFWDPAAESYELTFEVNDKGKVFISGTVDSWSEYFAAGRIAKGIRGVTEVVNDTIVKAKEERKDEEIKFDVEKALAWNTLIDDDLVEVDVENGEVELTGYVGSLSEKKAVKEAAHVIGVQKVDTSLLIVGDWSRIDEFRKETRPLEVKDESIRKAIKQANMLDPRVYSFDLNILVDDGHVTLEGTVDNVKAKRAAESNARHTVGVLKVENNLKIKPETIVSDEKLKNAVEQSLSKDPYLNKNAISVEVDEGLVTLRGEVETYFEKAQADDLASRIKGVWYIDNNLEVNDTEESATATTGGTTHEDWSYQDFAWHDFRPMTVQESDTEIKAEIESELFWSPFVDADQVDIEVQNGVATLKGTLDSDSEVQSAVENAYEGGAQFVDNELQIEGKN